MIPPQDVSCVSYAAEKYHVPQEYISRSMSITSSDGEQGMGVTGIPYAYLPILEDYGFDQYDLQNDDCTNIKAGALVISFALNGQHIEQQVHQWQYNAMPVSITARAQQWLPIITKISKYSGVPVPLIEAVITQESGFKPEVTSDKGAIGMMQLMPSTAASLGVNPDNPVENIWGGTWLLHNLMSKYHGDLDLTLAAYNAGSLNVSRYGGIPPFPETMKYVPSVENLYLSYQKKNR